MSFPAFQHRRIDCLFHPPGLLCLSPLGLFREMNIVVVISMKHFRSSASPHQCRAELSTPLLTGCCIFLNSCQRSSSGADACCAPAAATAQLAPLEITPCATQMTCSATLFLFLFQIRAQRNSRRNSRRWLSRIPPTLLVRTPTRAPWSKIPLAQLYLPRYGRVQPHAEPDKGDIYLRVRVGVRECERGVGETERTCVCVCVCVCGCVRCWA